MNEPIAEEIDGHDLQRFYADYRRALRMHHIGRLNLFFRLQFLSEDLPLETGGGDCIDQLDFRLWLSEPPPHSQAKHSGRAFTVVLIDADYFKQVNDKHGHGFGDIVLEVLAERFVESLRPYDRVYRYGGEEFLVMLPNTEFSEARPVLNRLRRIASSRMIGSQQTAIRSTVSVGAAEVTAKTPVRDAVVRADKALYRAHASPGPRFTAVDFSGGFCYTRAVDRAISRWTPDTRQEEALSKTQSHGCAQRDFIT